MKKIIGLLLLLAVSARADGDWTTSGASSADLAASGYSLIVVDTINPPVVQSLYKISGGALVYSTPIVNFACPLCAINDNIRYSDKTARVCYGLESDPPTWATCTDWLHYKPKSGTIVTGLTPGQRYCVRAQWGDDIVGSTPLSANGGDVDGSCCFEAQ